MEGATRVIGDQMLGEDRFRVMLGFGSAITLVLALSCCCVGSLLVNATDDGSQTQYREHPRSH